MAGDGALLLDERGEVHRIGTPKGKVVTAAQATAWWPVSWQATCAAAAIWKPCVLGTACGSATAFSLGLAKKEKIDALLATI